MRNKTIDNEVTRGGKAYRIYGKGAKNFIIKHKFACCVIAFVVFVGIGNAISNFGNRMVAASTTGSQVALAPIAVTADTLIKDQSDNASNAAHIYQGQYVEVTGKLCGIDTKGAYFSICPISDDFNFNLIICNNTDQQEEKVASFQSGQKVTIVGTITDVGEIHGYTLDVESIK